MEWFYRLYQAILLLAALTALVIARAAWKRRQEPGAGLFAWLLVVMAYWAVCYTLQLAVGSPAAKLFWVKIRFIGVIALPPLWLISVADFTGQRAWLARRRILELTIVPAFCILLLWTDPLHHLFFTSINYHADGMTVALIGVFGPVFWLQTVYGYLLMAGGMVLMVRELLKAWHTRRRQVIALLAAVLLPLLANVVSVASPSALGPVSRIDLTPVGLVLASIVYAVDLFQMRLSDLVPMARDAVFISLRDAVFVLDGRSFVVDANPTALRLLGLPAAHVLNRPAADLFANYPEMVTRFGPLMEAQAEVRVDTADGPQFWDVHITPLYKRSERPAGRLLTLHDITRQELAREAQRESEGRYRALFAAAERQAQELTLLNKVHELLAREMDLADVFRATVEGIAGAFGYTQVSLYLLEGDTLALAHQVGYDHVIERIFIEKGVSGQVARTGRPAWIEDVSLHPDFLHAVPGITSEVCVPLLDHGQVAGVLSIESIGSVRLTEADLRLMTVLAGYVGTAIERARLYAQLRESEEALRRAHDELEQRVCQRTAELSRATRRLEALHQIDRAILAAGPVEETAQLALQHIGQMVACDLAHVMVPGSVPGQACLLATFGPGSPDSSTASPADAPCLSIYPTETGMIEDTFALTVPSPQVNYLRGQGIRSVANGPLVSQSQVLGILCLGKRTPGPFTAEDLAIGSEIADQVAVALRQSQLREAQVRHAAELEQRVAERTADLLQREAALREAAEALRDANARLQDLDQLKSQFVSNVSHELRTPLTNIKLCLGLIERGKPEKRSQYMATLQRETDLLQRLIEDLLDLSRLDLGRAQPDLIPTDINLLVDTLVADRTVLIADRGLTLQALTEFDLPKIHADARMLTQVLTNLMTNAMNYTRPGGTITVRTTRQIESGRHWAILAVSDTGPGISADEQAHLFERFYRGAAGRASHAPGTGLGLAICHEIVKRHGGHITVKSAPGQGSTFAVWLPCTQ